MLAKVSLALPDLAECFFLAEEMCIGFHMETRTITYRMHDFEVSTSLSLFSHLKIELTGLTS